MSSTQDTTDLSPITPLADTPADTTANSSDPETTAPPNPTLNDNVPVTDTDSNQTAPLNDSPVTDSDPSTINSPDTENATDVPSTEPSAEPSLEVEPPAEPPLDPPGLPTLDLDDPDEGPFVPPTAPISTQYGITFYWDAATAAFVFDGVKDLDALALALGAAKLYYNIQQNWNGNQMELVPVSQEMFSLTVGMTNAFTNPDPPPVFGNNFHTAFVNNSVAISSGTSYVSAPTLTLDIAKPGLYAVHWYVEILIPEGAVEVLVLANGADNLSKTTYGQSSDGNDWRTISGFAVQAFPAGTPGLKLAYKYVDHEGQQSSAAPGSAATARNAKLMVYQVGRISS